MTGLRMAAIASALTVTAAAPSDAAIATFTSRDAFSAALVARPDLARTTQGFDGVPSGTLITTLDGVTYAPSVGTARVTNLFFEVSAPNGLGRSGTRFFDIGESITFSFASDIFAFGVSINTFETGPSYAATSNLGDVALSGFDPFPDISTGEFVGFISDTAFNAVTLADVARSSNSSYTLDDLIYATAGTVTPPPAGVPAPASLILLGSALIGLAASRVSAAR